MCEETLKAINKNHRNYTEQHTRNANEDLLRMSLLLSNPYNSTIRNLPEKSDEKDEWKSWNIFY